MAGMRCFALLMIASPIYAQTITTQAVTTMPLYTFEQSIGVNLHSLYLDGNYSNKSMVLSDLQQMHVTNVRDGLALPSQPVSEAIQDFYAANGIKFNFIFDGVMADLPAYESALDSFAQRHPGSIVSVEGPNEINNQPVAGPGTNQQNAVAYQRSLYGYVKQDAHLAGVQVVYFTGGDEVSIASLAGLADIANQHIYPQAAEQPMPWIEQGFSQGFTDPVSSYQKFMTETGYSTVPNESYNGVDDYSQAELIADDIFDACLAGSQHAYLYQLLQGYPDYATNPDTAYGLFHYTDNTPKYAAEAIQNYLGMLPADVPSKASAAVNVTFSGLPSNAKALALTASDGSIALAVWQEDPFAGVYNPNTKERISHANVPVSVQLQGRFSSVSFITPINDRAITQQPYGTYNSSPFYVMSVNYYPTLLYFKK